MLFENFVDVFYHIDLAGIILDISPSIKHLIELDRDEILGKNVSEFFYNPNDRELLLNEIKKTSKLRDYEWTFKTKNGEKRLASINANLIADVDGKPNHIYGTLRDITERKRAEEEIKLINKQLIKANAEKDKFFSIVSQDLRCPFYSLLDLTSLLSEGLPTMTQDQIKKSATTMRKSAFKIYNLLENLLEWSLMQRQ